MSQKSLFGQKYDGAVFSPCRTWRYTLWRKFPDNPDGKNVMFLMLNPSTATELMNDPTVRRTIGFAMDWGASQLVVTNLFAYRATLPADMMADEDPTGPDNDKHIREQAAQADLIICAWGNDGAHLERAKHVVRMLEKDERPLHYLKITGSGEPGHPLYLKADMRPQRLITHEGLLQTDIEHFTLKHKE